MNPWIGVLLIVIGLSAVVVFERLHIQQVSIGLVITTAGLAVIQAFGHATTQKKLALSLHPPPLPPGHKDSMIPPTTSSIEPPKS